MANTTYLQDLIVATNQQSQNDGYKLLCKYREGDEIYKGDIPVVEWFQKRINDEAGYEAWASLRIERRDNHSVIIRDWMPENKRELKIDISDHYFKYVLNPEYSKMWDDLPEIKKKKTPYVENEAQKKFRKDQLWMFRYGVYDSFFYEKHNILLRLFSGTEYMLLFYPKFMHEDKHQYLPPNYNRKISQLVDIIEILQNYELGLGENRERLFVAKCRGAMFTTTNHAVQVCNFFIHDYFKAWNTIDVASKISMETAKFQSFYAQFSEWIRPTLGVSPTAKGTNIREVRLGADKFGDKLFVQSLSRSTTAQFGRTNYVTNDEVGQIKSESIKTILDSFRGQLKIGGGTISGFQVVAGTSNANTQDFGGRNLEAWKSIHENAEMNAGFSFFIGRQHVQVCDPENGWANEKIVLDIKHKLREEMKRKGAYEDLQLDRMTDPIERDDCFLAVSTDELDFSRLLIQLERCKEQVADPYIRGMFVENTDYLPESYYLPAFHPNNDPTQAGWWLHRKELEVLKNSRLVFMKRPSSYYVAGSDNADKPISIDEQKRLMEGGTKLSHQAMIVLRVITGAIAAMYEYRHCKPEEDWKQMLLGCLFFQCRLLPEVNKPGNLNYFLYHSPHPYFTNGHFHEYIMDTPPAFSGGSRSFEYEVLGRTYKREVGVDTNRSTTPILVESFLKPYLSEPEDSYFGRAADPKEPEVRQGISQCLMEPFLHRLRLTKILATEKTNLVSIKAPDIVMASLMAQAARMASMTVAQRQEKQKTIGDTQSVLDTRWGL